MKAKELQKKYDKLYIIKKDGENYKLKDIYPICVLIHGEKEAVWIDQGNFGGYACEIKIIGNKLYVSDLKGNWKEEDRVKFK